MEGGRGYFPWGFLALPGKQRASAEYRRRAEGRWDWLRNVPDVSFGEDCNNVAFVLIVDYSFFFDSGCSLRNKIQACEVSVFQLEMHPVPRDRK